MQIREKFVIGAITATLFFIVSLSSVFSSVDIANEVYTVDTDGTVSVVRECDIP